MRIFLAGVFGLIILGLIALMALLLPAHLQIRQLDIVLPDAATILDLDSDGRDLPIDVSVVTTAQQRSGLGTVGHAGVLITWNDGRQFLIDTGMDRAAAIEFGKLIETMFGADPTETFGPIEEQLGDDINRIKGIAFTHLHSDHTHGITAVCAAMSEPATIIQTSHQATEQNLHTEDGQTWVNASVCRKNQIGDNSLISIEGFDGLYAIPAGGHTPGSTIFVVQTHAHSSTDASTHASTNLWILSGDITNDMQSIHNDTGKGVLYSYLAVPEDTALTEKWRRWLRDLDKEPRVTVLPAHDIELMRAHLKER